MGSLMSKSNCQADLLIEGTLLKMSKNTVSKGTKYCIKIL